MEMKVLENGDSHREYCLPNIESAFIFALYSICRGRAEVISKPGRVEFHKDGEIAASMQPVYPGVGSNDPDTIINWFITLLGKAELTTQQRAVAIRLCVPNIRSGRYWRGNVSEILTANFGRKVFENCDLYL